FLYVFGRLKDEVSVEQAQTQMSTIARRLEQDYPDQQSGRGVRVYPLQEGMVSGVRPVLYVLWGAVGFILLIACTNVANLLLARVGFGIAPALQASSPDVQEALKEGGNAGQSPYNNWLRGLLVIAEVASALVLLVGAGLLIRSFARLQQVDLGFEPRGALTM